MQIRRAQGKDIEGVGKLLVQVNMVHHNGRPDLFNGPAQKYSAAQLMDIFEDDDRPVFIAADEKDQVMGYVFCAFQQHIGDNIMTDIRTLYIDDLCVDEKIRGQHTGQKLYQYVLDYAGQQGCHNVTLHVWSCNTSAMKFYEKCGLKPQYISMEQIID